MVCVWVLFEKLLPPAKALLMPQLDALLDKRANLAVGECGGAQLDTQAAPLHQLLAPELHTTWTLGRRCGYPKLGACGRCTPLGEQSFNPSRRIKIAIFRRPPPNINRSERGIGR
eukprot:3712980-Prymnesium_polylepis.3